MVRLDGAAFENVGIDGALCEEGDAVLLARLFLKHADKLCPDDLALFFGFRDALQLFQETLRRVYIDEVCVHPVAEHLDDLFGFALAQKPVVDVHADEIFADSFDEERGDDGRIHPAGQCEEHFFLPHLRLYSCDLFTDELFRKFPAFDARHVFGALVVAHRCFPPLVLFNRVSGDRSG